MEQKLKEAWQHLKAVQATAQGRRDDHLGETAKANAEKHDVTAEAALKVIRRAEDDKFVFACIRQYLGAHRSGAINKLHVP